TLAFKCVDRPPTDTLGVTAVVVVGAGIEVRGLREQEMVESDEPGVGRCDHRLLVPAMPHDESAAWTCARPTSTRAGGGDACEAAGQRPGGRVRNSSAASRVSGEFRMPRCAVPRTGS